VAPFKVEATADRAVYLVWPRGHEARPKISAFRAWIREEVDRLGATI
jgi:DNA-binding transcriptional LysR family regulator